MISSAHKSTIPFNQTGLLKASPAEKRPRGWRPVKTVQGDLLKVETFKCLLVFALKVVCSSKEGGYVGQRTVLISLMSRGDIRDLACRNFKLTHIKFTWAQVGDD